MNLEIAVERNRDIVLIKPGDKIDANNGYPAYLKRIHKIFDFTGVSRIEYDFSNVSLLDPTGLTAVLSLFNINPEMRMTFLNVNPDVHKVLHPVAFEPYVTIMKEDEIVNWIGRIQIEASYARLLLLFIFDIKIRIRFYWIDIFFI